MTGRVCPVHGEYSASGACRWCDPGPEKYSRDKCDNVSIFRGVEYDWTRGPVVEDLADASLAVCSFDLEDALQELWRRMHARAVSVPIYMLDFAAEDARIASQHAALRWERVARRWGSKHRGGSGLSGRDRDRVWMHWLQQMDRRFPRREP